MKLSNSNIKKLPIFSQEKDFLIFCEMIPPTLKKKKKIQETKISGNGNPKIPVQSKFNFCIILIHFDHFLVSFLVSICYVPKHLKNSKTNDVN